VARSAADLGLFLRNQGDRAAAAPYLRRALNIDEKTLGSDSPVVGEDLENLASVLPPAEALPLYRRASEHRDPAIAARNLSKLASYEESRDRHNAALVLYRQALVKEEAASGAAHPRVAVRLNDVALLVEPKEAEPLLRRALTIQEKVLGPRNPETATTLNNLANVLLATGRTAQAEPLARRALSMLEQTLGPHHPRVATGSSNLADILRAKKDHAAARRFYERALAIDEKSYGPSHPEVLVDLENLAGLLDEIGRREEARRLRERAAGIKDGR
jgi:tetratricopeptide (TPR) repeat protein